MMKKVSENMKRITTGREISSIPHSILVANIITLEIFKLKKSFTVRVIGRDREKEGA